MTGRTSGPSVVFQPTRPTLPFCNRASRYHLVIDAINNARRTPPGASAVKAWAQAQLDKHQSHIIEHLEDMPEVREWTWQRAERTV